MKEIRISRNKDWVNELTAYRLKLSTGEQITLSNGESKSISISHFPATLNATIVMGGASKEITIDGTTSEIRVKGNKFFNNLTLLIPMLIGPLLRPLFEDSYSWPPTYLLVVASVQLLWTVYALKIKNKDWLILEKVNA